MREQIKINGRTNINKFECKLELEEPVDTLAVTVKKVNGSFDFSGLTLNIPVSAFNCKYKLMTAEFRELLNAEEHPFLKLNIAHAEYLSEEKVQMHMNLSVAEKRREEMIRDCHVFQQGELLFIGGHHTIYLTTYDIEPPRKFFGAVVVKNELDINFEVVLTSQQKKEPQ